MAMITDSVLHTESVITDYIPAGQELNDAAMFQGVKGCGQVRQDQCCGFATVHVYTDGVVNF